jgi:hypothetical protein
MTGPAPGDADTDWIDDLSDEECMEIFWLYVDPPEPFLQRHPPALLGQALRFALKAVARAAARPS